MHIFLFYTYRTSNAFFKLQYKTITQFYMHNISEYTPKVQLERYVII